MLQAVIVENQLRKLFWITYKPHLIASCRSQATNESANVTIYFNIRVMVA